MKCIFFISILMVILVGCSQKTPDGTLPLVENVNSVQAPAVIPSETTNVTVDGSKTTPSSPEAEVPAQETPSTDFQLNPKIKTIELDADLANFPEIFLGELNGKTVSNTIIVIGKNAPAKDVISAMAIATVLNEPIENKDNSAKTVLDTEVKSVLDRNAIVIGSPCDNPKVLELTKISDCHSDLEKGKAMIKIYENNGHIQMHIVGYDADGTYKAALKLADYKTQAFKGKQFLFSYS